MNGPIALVEHEANMACSCSVCVKHFGDLSRQKARDEETAGWTPHFFRKLFGIKTASSKRSSQRLDKDEVREGVDIISLYTFLTGNAPRRTSGRYVQVRCPFHGEDKTASMSLDTKLKRYNCFTCLESGDAFKLYMNIEGCSFPQAVERIARL